MSEELTKEPVKARQITINEFRMWLEGVEEMQAVGWVPDERQWRRIREKINEIIDVPQQPKYTAPPVPLGPVNRGADVAHHTIPAQPAGPSLMPNPAFSVGAPRQPTQLPSILASGSGQTPVRTPDIDTQGRPYESSFAS
jgi:hypothetical protein